MKKRKTHEQFVSELFLINPNIEVISEYIGCIDKVKCKCKIDGHMWDMTPNNLLRGHGCPECKKHSVSKACRKTHEEFVEELYFINDNIEILSPYNGTHSKIKCKCKIDGYIWDTTPHHLLMGYGCPKCKSSIGEKKICEILQELNIYYIEQYRFNDCRNKRPLPFDFYLPDHNACIEYQGGQHYFAVTYFGGQDKFEDQQKKDEIKRIYCKNNDIKLIEIPYWDFDNIKSIIEEKIL